jgi:hypothetical protein
MNRLIKISRNSNKLQRKKSLQLKKKKVIKNQNCLERRKLTGNKATMNLTGKMSTGGKIQITLNQNKTSIKSLANKKIFAN